MLLLPPLPQALPLPLFLNPGSAVAPSSFASAATESAATGQNGNQKWPTTTSSKAGTTTTPIVSRVEATTRTTSHSRAETTLTRMATAVLRASRIMATTRAVLSVGHEDGLVRGNYSFTSFDW